MKVLAVTLVMISVLVGQQTPTSNIPFATAPPSGASTVNGRVVGNQGNATYTYWIVATLPQGQSTVSVPAVVRNAPNTLTAGNRVELSWSAVGGATSYTVIRTTGTSGTFPGSCTGCQVATGVTGVTASDTGGALSSFTYAPIGTATGNMRLNNDGINPVAFVFVPPVSGGAGATIPVTTNALRGDGTGNGAAVTGTPTNCVLVNGTSATCGTAGALTQVQVCSIESFSPNGDGVTNDAPAFTAAQAVCAMIQLTANKNYAITTPLTLNSAVNFIGGSTMIANNAALVMNGSVIGPLTRIFTISGTGTIRINSGTPLVYPEWFGAAPDGVTDSTAAIQAGINSRTFGCAPPNTASGSCNGGVVDFQTGTYLTSSTLTIVTRGITLQGKGRELTTTINANFATGNVLTISTTGANCAGGNQAVNVRDMAISRSIQATSGDSINITNSCFTTIQNVIADNSINGVHIFNSANTTLDYVKAEAGGSLTRNGFFLDSTGGASNASTNILHAVADGGGSNMTGMLVQGDCIADLFIDKFEIAGIDYGMRVISTNSSSSIGGCNDDVHLNHMVLDQCLVKCLTISGVNNANQQPSINVIDAAINCAGPGLIGIDVSNSKGVVIAEAQIHCNFSGQTGISLNNSANNGAIVNSVFTANQTGLSISNSSNNVITGNNFTSPSGQASIVDLAMSSNCFTNQITHNIFGGSAATAITIDATCLGNILWPNTIQPGVVTTAMSVAAGSKGNIVVGEGFSTPTIAGCGTLNASSTNATGSVTSTVTGTCVGTINFDFSRMGQPATGWACSFSTIQTSLTNTIQQSSLSRTAVIFQGTTVTGDQILYQCRGF